MITNNTHCNTLQHIADEIEDVIYKNSSTEKDQYGYPVSRGYSNETIEKFLEAVILLKRAQIFAHRIDWLLSDDDSEGTFLERLEEDLFGD